MKEAKIVLPLVDNDGVSLASELDAAEVAILEAFGGYSVADTRGAWRDPETGVIYRDEHRTYTIAGDWDDVLVAGQLLNLAAHLSGNLRQLCIYVALPDGVHFVEPAKVAA